MYVCSQLCRPNPHTCIHKCRERCVCACVYTYNTYTTTYSNTEQCEWTVVNANELSSADKRRQSNRDNTKRVTCQRRNFTKKHIYTSCFLFLKRDFYIYFCLPSPDVYLAPGAEGRWSIGYGVYPSLQTWKERTFLRVKFRTFVKVILDI